MDKGTSIFYEYHEQGCPHEIAGIYTPYSKTEEELRTELLSLLGKTEFHERETITFVNHTHLYANMLLGEKLSTETLYVLNKFFPKGIDTESLPTAPMKFYNSDVGANEFIWNNRYYKELKEHRKELQKASAEAYEHKRRSN